MFTCILCNKYFSSKFNLERHKSNKTPCNISKESYNCDICKSNFGHKSHFDIHNKTKKHINNYNKYKKVKISLDEIKLKEEIELLKNKNKLLENVANENKIKKQYPTKSECDNLEYVYLLQERTAVALNKPIYKIGRTNQPNFERFKGYHKGYKILLHVVCNDCKDIEQKIIDLFIKNYNHYTEYGNEYFEGNYKSMIKDIFSLVV
jgi:hypothetical protein